MVLQDIGRGRGREGDWKLCLAWLKYVVVGIDLCQEKAGRHCR